MAGSERKVTSEFSYDNFVKLVQDSLRNLSTDCIPEVKNTQFIFNQKLQKWEERPGNITLIVKSPLGKARNVLNKFMDKYLDKSTKKRIQGKKGHYWIDLTSKEAEFLYGKLKSECGDAATLGPAGSPPSSRAHRTDSVYGSQVTSPAIENNEDKKHDDSDTPEMQTKGSQRKYQLPKCFTFLTQHDIERLDQYKLHGLLFYYYQLLINPVPKDGSLRWESYENELNLLKSNIKEILLSNPKHIDYFASFLTSIDPAKNPQALNALSIMRSFRDEVIKETELASNKKTPRK